jgi:uncharacterized phage protein (TIGR02216 family)
MSEASRLPFPWAAAIGFGLGILRLSPDAFWSMTPRELAAAIRARRGDAGAPLDRHTLLALMQRFPDGSDDGARDER